MTSSRGVLSGTLGRKTAGRRWRLDPAQPPLLRLDMGGCRQAGLVLDAWMVGLP